MRAEMHWTGIETLTGNMRALEAAWTQETQQDAQAAAEATAASARATYTAHRRSGELAGSVRVTRRQGGVGARVTPEARHAFFFEYGTRYMRGWHALVPNAVEARRAFLESCERRVQQSLAI